MPFPFDGWCICEACRVLGEPEPRHPAHQEDESPADAPADAKALADMVCRILGIAVEPDLTIGRVLAALEAKNSQWESGYNTDPEYPYWTHLYPPIGGGFEGEGKTPLDALLAAVIACDEGRE